MPPSVASLTTHLVRLTGDKVKEAAQHELRRGIPLTRRLAIVWKRGASGLTRRSHSALALAIQRTLHFSHSTTCVAQSSQAEREIERGRERVRTQEQHPRPSKCKCKCSLSVTPQRCHYFALLRGCNLLEILTVLHLPRGQWHLQSPSSMALPSVAKLDHEPVDSLYQIYDEKPSGLGEYGKVYDAVS